MNFTEWLRAGALAGAVVCAALPAFALGDPEESCVGEVHLHGPLWNPETGTLEPGVDVMLDAAARTIREHCARHSIVIEAHALEEPGPELNQKLSELSAAIVRDELVKRGVPAGQLLPIGVGDTHPQVPQGQAGSAPENLGITFRVLD